MKIMKRTIILLMCSILLCSSTGIKENTVEAKATKKAMKFLKGT